MSVPERQPLIRVPAARLEHVFPTLTAEQIGRVALHGHVRHVAKGEVLIEAGAASIPFFVVTAGSLEVVRPSASSDTLITVHHPGGFTGEVNMLTGRRTLVRSRAAEDSEVIELTRDQLLSFVQTDPQLGDIFMRAFILRRIELIASGIGDVVLIGSVHSPGTLRIKEFLTRNGHPYTYIDLERDADVQELLDRFHVTVHDVPVVICRGDMVLRNPTNQQVAECLGFNETIDADARSRSRRRRRRSGGTGGRGVRRLGRPGRPGARKQRARRPGGIELEDRELPRISDRHFRSGSRRAGLPAGAEVRRTGDDRERGDGADLRSSAVPHQGRRRHARFPRGRSSLRRAPSIASCRSPTSRAFEGAGVYYGATFVEAQLCGGEEVVVVGGGNSAGQAAVFLAQTARHVHMLVRSAGLADTMSRYLIRRIEDNPAISLRHTHRDRRTRR